MTGEEQILQRLLLGLSRIAPPGAPLSPDVDLVQELGLDSIKVMDLVMDLEDDFDVSVPLNVLAEVRTPRQLAGAVHSLREAADGAVR